MGTEKREYPLRRQGERDWAKEKSRCYEGGGQGRKNYDVRERYWKGGLNGKGSGDGLGLAGRKRKDRMPELKWH